MMMINPDAGWLEIVEIPALKIDEVMKRDYEYIDMPYSIVSQIFNNKCLSRYPLPHKFVFNNESEFKQDFNPLIIDLYIKQVLENQNPQANDKVEKRTN